MKKTGFLLILLSAVVTLTTAFSFESRPIHKTLNVTVTGSVVDEKGEAMAGAIVMVKGTKMGTSIDFDGKYRLSIPAQKCTLVCSAIGFVAQEKEVVLEEGKPQKVDFTMAENTQLLDAVVIREYKVPIVKVDQTVQGHQFTSSEIAKMPLSNSTAPKLQGRVAGVAVRGSRHIKLWGRKKSINTIQTPTIKGSRADGTDYYINGVRVRGKKNIKRFQDSIEQTAGFNTEEYGHWVENNYKSPKDDALSTFSIDVDRASYANVRRFIEQGSKPPAGAVRIEEMVNYFDYKYPQPTSEHPLSIISEIGTCPWQKDHLLLHIGLQGKKIDLEKAPKNNLVFLIDVSGSMNEPNKLPLVKDALRILINNLREEDRVAIVVYAGAAGVVLPSTSGANKGKFLESLDRSEEHTSELQSPC